MTGRNYALITGASKGLGKFFARALAERKQDLVIVARSGNKLERVASELRDKHGVTVEPLQLDLAMPAAGQHLVKQLQERALPISLLINNAGLGLRGEFFKLPLERQLEMINLNNATVIELTHQLLPPMIAERKGGIINVSSTAGFQPIPYALLYSATKAFLTTFSLGLEREVRRHGISVVTVCPGRLCADPDEAGEERQKFPGGEQSHEEVVIESLKVLDAGGGLVVPGFVNKFSIFAQRFIPRSVVPKLVAKMSKPQA
jgi:short-subunit dehydrogenase